MSEMSPLLLSVIIPTVGSRNALLERAVESVRATFTSDDIEIIVVLNFNLDRFSALQELFSGKENVRIVCCKAQGVSAARNHGFQYCRGDLVKFLDDDDYVLAAGFKEQVLALKQSQHSASSGPIEEVYESSGVVGRRAPVANVDGVCGVLHPSRLQLPISWVFRREAIANISWEPGVSDAEDALYLLDMIRCCPNFSWCYQEQLVGVWFQHGGERLGQRYTPNASAKRIFARLTKIYESKVCDSQYRVEYLAAAFWACVVIGFKFSPLYWHRVARKLNKIVPGSRPEHQIFRVANNFGFSPVFVLWLLLPVFILVRLKRALIG
jgi:glycosyltransferase involved in cell wall biosynthesis